jgi:bifunctional UDP-N-acetylglucosamine pyrophosphorylase/glucosamine-1-phosphate N-acetyltransferase/UDP-N-acetylglucosamine pyrophosphorylase
MIRYVIDAVRAAGVLRTVIVVGYRGELVREEFAGEPDITFATQAEQLGTGHAVMMARGELATHDGPVVVLAGDSPMVQVSSLEALLAEFSAAQPACLLGTAKKANPTGLGRIIRSPNGDFQGIVEEKDATAEQKAITEVNLSTYVFDSNSLLWALGQLTADNLQGEYYLTDCPGVLRSAGKPVAALCVLKPCETLSINTADELAIVEAEMRKRVE